MDESVPWLLSYLCFQPLLLSALAVCHARAPSLALSCLCPHTPFLAPVLSFPRVSPRIQTPFTRDHPIHSTQPPKCMLPPRNRGSSPSPRICKKVWVCYLGPQGTLDLESQLLLLSRRSSASLLSDLSSGLVTRGPPPGPSPLHVWAPSPGIRPPAGMNGTAVPLGRKTLPERDSTRGNNSHRF